MIAKRPRDRKAEVECKEAEVECSAAASWGGYLRRTMDVRDIAEKIIPRAPTNVPAVIVMTRDESSNSGYGANDRLQSE